MTTERDDPQGQARSAGNASGRELRARDRLLCKWAIRRTAAEMIDIPPAVVETIAYEAYLQYQRFRESVRDPLPLLVKRMRARAEAYRKSRDGSPSEPPKPPAPPDLLELVRKRIGAAGMTESQREALTLLFDGTNKTYAEIALELDVTALYVQTIVESALAPIREWAAQQWPEVLW